MTPGLELGVGRRQDRFGMRIPTEELGDHWDRSV